MDFWDDWFADKVFVQVGTLTGKNPDELYKVSIWPYNRRARTYTVNEIRANQVLNLLGQCDPCIEARGGTMEVYGHWTRKKVQS
jgi:hypothetical protein